jgi:hypothetical protein
MATALLAIFFPMSLGDVPGLDEVSSQSLHHLPGPEGLAIEQRTQYFTLGHFKSQLK